ncbi:hypothetical protein BJ546DRAFT_129754 [Cryomyces antarcticus]
MEQPSVGRPRSKSTFSFRSNKSDKSSTSKPKMDLRETEADKRRSKFQLGSKADPNAAMNESQPADTSIGSLTIRATQHKDAYGNPITDPDLSNPTRPRWERPLDTIRSFEKAIDGGYKRRSSMNRTDSSDMASGMTSRRSSYYAGFDLNQTTSRLSQIGGGYYGGRGGQSRPDSYADSYGPPSAPSPRNRYNQRVVSDPVLMRYNNGQSSMQGVYPQLGYHQSYDTVNTGVTNGSDSTGPWANSTDPSSENSSIDKVNALTSRPDQSGENHGSNGPNGPSGPQGQFRGPIMEEYGPGSNGGAYPNPNAFGQIGYPSQNGNGYAPALPAHTRTPPSRNVIKLGGDSSSSAFTSASPSGPTYPASSSRPSLQPTPSKNEKKKGWLKSRLSKKD